MSITVEYIDGREEDLEYFQPRSLPYIVLNPQEIDEEVKNIIQYIDDLYLPSLEGSRYIEAPPWVTNSIL